MKKTRIVRHHISHDPEIEIPIYDGEHMILSWLNRWKRAPTKGFVDEIKKWLATNENRAITINK